MIFKKEDEINVETKIKGKITACGPEGKTTEWLNIKDQHGTSHFFYVRDLIFLPKNVKPIRSFNTDINPDT